MEYYNRYRISFWFSITNTTVEWIPNCNWSPGLSSFLLNQIQLELQLYEVEAYLHTKATLPFSCINIPSTSNCAYQIAMKSISLTLHKSRQNNELTSMQSACQMNWKRNHLNHNLYQYGLGNPRKNIFILHFLKSFTKKWIYITHIQIFPPTPVNDLKMHVLKLCMQFNLLVPNITKVNV